MAKDPTKLSRADKRANKKALRAAKKVARKERWAQIRMAFTVTRQRDSRLIWWLVLTFVAVFAVLFSGLALLGVWWPVALLMGLTLGVMSALVVFSRRAQKAAFSEAEGQPGAAVWVLQNMRGNWRVTPAVAGNTQLDAVHRVLGRPGVILIGEGADHRVKGLLSQEKRKVSRIVGDTPIYDVVVGRDEGQIPLRRLQAHLVKLPANLSAKQVGVLEKRLAALGGTKLAMPKGPMPKNARGMTGIQRTIRRR
ncbi:MAG TPA: DUF4191 domain-containing protein [Mycobacteriales bacterium]|nr:DUF4191 domain-containing protein [Mycobacteriales bacterium]